MLLCVHRPFQKRMKKERVSRVASGSETRLKGCGRLSFSFYSVQCSNALLQSTWITFIHFYCEILQRHRISNPLDLPLGQERQC